MLICCFRNLVVPGPRLKSQPSPRAKIPSPHMLTQFSITIREIKINKKEKNKKKEKKVDE
jgi:hypothetical protein